MHRLIFVGFVCATVLVGCGARTPVSPDVGSPSVTATAQTQPVYDERYGLWSEWTWYIPETHDRVDVVPRRTSQVHVNVLKWLEVDCPDCLRITNVKKNGDSTIDVTVQIRHPKPGHPELTGFDVKGIIMFNGSHALPGMKPFFPYPDDFRISWREKGDPELLNPDGYTVRWCPDYPSGSSSPLLNYWPGKYSGGTPTANVNGYIDFYTKEDRHIFTDYGIATRVYHIYLPPGPLTAGYAVEACWMPPDKIPVTDPAIDFPLSANQEEPYFLRYVINNGEPVQPPKYCCGWDYDCSDLRLEALQWAYHDLPDEGVNLMKTCKPEPYWGGLGHNLHRCTEFYPEWLYGTPESLMGPSEGYPPGTYRGLAIVYRGYHAPPDYVLQMRDQIAYTVWDFTAIEE
jgi:hypothetical protein